MNAHELAQKLLAMPDVGVDIYDMACGSSASADHVRYVDVEGVGHILVTDDPEIGVDR